MLSAESIAALADERAALAEFRAKLETLAATLPAIIRDESLVEERLDDLLNDMFREWQQDQANLGPTGRRFFGEGVISESGKLARSLVEAALKPDSATDAAKGAAIGGISGLPSGHLTMPVVVGAGAGFIVAILVRGVESWRKDRETARNSPLRYLTSLQKQGVSFSLSR